MRIVSGIYGGRRLSAPEGRDVRPTSDKVRGAIFNALTSRIDLDGAQVLDVFCGSGALGLEALSRGAAHCTFVDKARDSVALARENAAMLGVKAAAFMQADAAKIGVCNGEKAGLVFLDPPYAKGLVVPALEALQAGRWLADGCVCVVEVEKAFTDALPTPFLIDAEKVYGDTKVLFLSYPA
jgi:16S rRNA (guanine966-N2)-methyltransferase